MSSKLNKIKLNVKGKLETTLKGEGFILFGSKTCPHCKKLEKELEGHKVHKLWLQKEGKYVFNVLSKLGIIQGYPTLYSYKDFKTKKIY